LGRRDTGIRSILSKFPIYCDLIWQPKAVGVLELSRNENAPFQVSFLGMITNELYRNNFKLPIHKKHAPLTANHHFF